jgi:hypothetical protein
VCAAVQGEEEEDDLTLFFDYFLLNFSNRERQDHILF